jgi:hypothetical protein
MWELKYPQQNNCVPTDILSYPEELNPLIYIFIQGQSNSLGQTIATGSSKIHVSFLDQETCISASFTVWCVRNYIAFTLSSMYTCDVCVSNKLLDDTCLILWTCLKSKHTKTVDSFLFYELNIHTGTCVIFSDVFQMLLHKDTAIS